MALQRKRQCRQMFFCEQYQESKCSEMRLYGEMWGVAGGSGETQCRSVRDCCWCWPARNGLFHVMTLSL